MQNYTTRMGFRVTEKEYEQIKKRADAYGLPLSDFIRRMVLGKKLVMPKIKMVDQKAIAELNRQGGLLKKYYTDTKGENKEMTRAILNKMGEIVTMIAKEYNEK